MIRPIPPLLLAAALAALTACDEATDGASNGPPLVTLGGTLELAARRSFDESRPVRLAVVWFNFSHTPKAVVPQPLEYRGTFPIHYAFDLYAPPPAAALSDFGSFKSAHGWVAAYQDGNGNGSLDTIPHSGTKQDVLLGISRIAVRYFTTSGGTSSVPQGYSLSDEHDLGVPTSTPISIELSGDPSLAFLICEDAGLPQIPADGPCKMPYPGVTGAVGFVDGVSVASLSATLNGQAVTDGSASVRVNGRAIPSDGKGGYHLEDAGSAFVLPATNEVEVSAGGGANATTVDVPGEFHLLGPGAGPFPAGSRLQVQWSEAARARSCYRLELRDAAGRVVSTATATGATSAELLTSAQDRGAMTLRVDAGCIHWSGLLAVDAVRAVTAQVVLE